MSEQRLPKTKVIRGSTQQKTAKATSWQPPSVHGLTPQDSEHGGSLLTASQLEALTEKAHAEGYEEGHRQGLEYGHREGLESGRSQIQARIANFDHLLEGLEQPFAELDQQVENEIVTLVIAMVRQLVRREVKADPAQIVGVVREALAVLPVSARSVRVMLHPEDAQLVREAYELGDADQKWQIVEDPVVSRGGCRILTENSQVDATLESRLNALIAPLLANERDSDD